MKSLMVLTLLFFAASCGDDDDGGSVSPDLENAEFAFETSAPPITVPSALSGSNNQEAATINGYLQLANSMTGWLTLFEAPQSATKSNTPIGRKAAALNGRTQEDVVVYTWTYDDRAGTGVVFTVAYQISETDSDYIFETFWKINDGEFVKVLYAEESKDDLRNGYMEIYVFALFDEESDVLTDDYFFRYEWSEEADGAFAFRFVDSEGSIEMEILVNADNSGSLTYELDGNLFYEATWNATGTSGTYASYGFDGELIESGTWEA